MSQLYNKNDPARHHNISKLIFTQLFYCLQFRKKSFTFQHYSSQLYHNSKYNPLMTLQSGDTAFFCWLAVKFFLYPSDTEIREILRVYIENTISSQCGAKKSFRHMILTSYFQTNRIQYPPQPNICIQRVSHHIFVTASTLLNISLSCGSLTPFFFFPLLIILIHFGQKCSRSICSPFHFIICSFLI